jgi:hypothetical protein
LAILEIRTASLTSLASSSSGMYSVGLFMHFRSSAE